MTIALQSQAALNESLYPAGPWRDLVLTHAGTLIGALELQGVDPKGLSEADFSRLAATQRHMIQSLHQDVVLTQYYFHFRGASVSVADRQNPRSRLLSERRQNFLNETRQLAQARLFWMVECRPHENLNNYFSTSFLRTLFASPFDKTARNKLRIKLSHRDAYLADIAELGRQEELVRNTLANMQRVLTLVAPNNEQLDLPQLWGLMRAVVNINPRYIEDGRTEGVPTNHWDRLLAAGDVKPIVVDGKDMLKVDGAVPTYCRVASVTGYGAETTPEGLWGRGDLPPAMQAGNYMIVTRFSPLSELDRGFMLDGKSNELHRSQIKIADALTGKMGGSETEKRIQGSDYLKTMLKELEDANTTADRFGYFQSHVVVFGADPGRVNVDAQNMDQALTQNRLKVAWESAGLSAVYPAIQPGYPKRGFRTTAFTTSQAGAASLVYRPHQGMKTWDFGGKAEEAQYIFESEDGSPFYYTPFVGDKCLVIGVGPTRSGKTFTLTTLAAHFLKFGGFYHSLGVDPGAEPLARFFKEEGGIFRIEDPATTRGLNPFVSATGSNDGAFKNHMLGMVRMMLKLNDSEQLRELEPHEQRELDNALQQVLDLKAQRPDLMSLSAVYNHSPQSLKQKLDRWVRGKMYGNLFDNDVDGIGSLTTRVSVYNLAGVKDTPALAQLVMQEIFFRVIRLFEDPQYRNVPKFLETDEAQYILSIPGAAETAIAKARTWFKHGGGMGFWTQSPQHYAALPEWATLRSSATTFMFMADGQMDRNAYRETFHLQEGELDAIARLVPQRQAYIIQREIGVSKVVNVIATPEEYVLATSRPNEATIVKNMLDIYPDIDDAVSHAVNAIFEGKESK